MFIFHAKMLHHFHDFMHFMDVFVLDLAGIASIWDCIGHATRDTKLCGPVAAPARILETQTFNQPLKICYLSIRCLQYMCIYIYVPRAPMTSIFEVQPPQNKAFSNQNKGPHLGSKYKVYKSVLISYPKNPIPSLLTVPTLSSRILGVIPVRGYSWLRFAEIVLH